MLLLLRQSQIGLIALTSLSLLLPCASNAQKPATASSEVTSLFVEPLTRTRLGKISHVESSVAPLAHTAADGHMVVTGIDTNVMVAAGHYVELLPNIDIPGFHSVSLAVFENGTRTQTFGMDRNSGIPFIRIDPPVGAVNRKRVQIALYDAEAHVRTVQQCILRSHVAAAPPALTATIENEKCALAVSDRQTLGAVDFALNGCSLGRLAASEAQAVVDGRRLMAGHYTCEAFPRTEEGVLLPPVKTEFDIETRYVLTLPTGASFVHIGAPLDTNKVALEVLCQPATHIAKTRVYIDGEFVAENSQPHFTQEVPLMDVPTGKTTIDVIGVAADGTLYPVESVPISVKNDVWENRIYSTPEYAQLQTKRAEVAENRRQFESWYEKFANEPFSRAAGTEGGTYLMRDGVTGYTYWQTIVNTHYAATNAIPFKRNADKYLQALAKSQLEAGRLEVRLKMKQQARRRFNEVIHEVGEEASVGAQAKSELQSLSQIKE